MKPNASNKPFAVVTGASSGIGAEFSRLLAARGHDVLVAARRGDRLEAIRAELHELGSNCTPLVCDLETTAGRDSLLRAVDTMGVPDLFVNNAGFGYFGHAIEQDLGDAVRMIRLNVETVAVLALEIARRMKTVARGGIITVASTAAFQATPFHALYGATKAFDLLLSEALSVELEGTGVRTLAVCPGYTRTEFQQIARVPGEPSAWMIADARDCAERALAAFDRRKTVFVHGAVNKLGPVAARLLPRKFVARAGGNMYRPPR